MYVILFFSICLCFEFLLPFILFYEDILEKEGCDGWTTFLMQGAYICRLNGGKRGAARKLLTFIDMVNETTGDSISDLLIVETILHARGWSVEDWENCYTDLPNRQLKITVQVCNIFVLLIKL